MQDASTANSVHVTARDYPWLYMTSLDRAFENEDDNVPHDLGKGKAKETTTTEDEDSDQSESFEAAARRLQFNSDGESEQFATSGPKIIQAFLAHEKVSTLAENEALSIANSSEDVDSVDVFDGILRTLENLLNEAKKIESDVKDVIRRSQLPLPLLDSTIPSSDADNPGPAEEASAAPDEDRLLAREQVLHVFTSTLPVIHARMSNLTMASELVEGAKEVWTMSRHLESVDVDSEDDEEEGDEGVAVHE